MTSIKWSLIHLSSEYYVNTPTWFPVRRKKYLYIYIYIYIYVCVCKYGINPMWLLYWHLKPCFTPSGIRKLHSWAHNIIKFVDLCITSSNWFITPRNKPITFIEGKGTEQLIKVQKPGYSWNFTQVAGTLTNRQAKVGKKNLWIPRPCSKL